MKRIHFISVFILLSTGFFSCKKGEGTYIPASSANLIVGTWALQTEHYVQYINGVKQLDTVYNASQNSYVDIQFKTNGTFVTSGVYYSAVQSGSLSSNPTVVNFTSSGTYSFAGSVFKIAGPLSGFGNGSGFYGLSTTTTVPIITAVSNSVKVNQVTNTNLAIHSEDIYTSTVNNVSQTYKIEADLSYTR